MKQISECDLCGSHDLIFLFSGHDRIFDNAQSFDIVQCSQCSLIMQNPQIELSELDIAYPKQAYYSLTQPTKKSFLGKINNYIYKLYFSHRKNFFFRVLFAPIRPLLRTVLVVPKGNFLDVGSGSGEFLLRARSLRMNVYGVEPGSFDKEFAKKNGLNIFPGDLFSAKFPEDYFDVITLNHVFEHVPSPTLLLQELKRILKPGGSIIVTVPNVSSLPFKLFKQFWVNLEIPRHLYHYSPKTLKLYAYKTGLIVTKLNYNSDPFRFLGSFLNVLTDASLRKKRQLSINKKLYNDQLMLFNIIINFLLLPFRYFMNFLHVGDTIEIVVSK